VDVVRGERVVNSQLQRYCTDCATQYLGFIHHPRYYNTSHPAVAAVEAVEQRHEQQSPKDDIPECPDVAYGGGCAPAVRIVQVLHASSIASAIGVDAL
jgi:hypothetical protein